MIRRSLTYRSVLCTTMLSRTSRLLFFSSVPYCSVPYFSFYILKLAKHPAQPAHPAHTVIGPLMWSSLTFRTVRAYRTVPTHHAHIVIGTLFWSRAPRLFLDFWNMFQVWNLALQQQFTMIPPCTTNDTCRLFQCSNFFSNITKYFDKKYRKSIYIYYVPVMSW